MAGKTVVICSDDASCREAAKRFFVESTVLTVTDIPATGGEPIHFLTDDAYGKNITMLTDLFALAGARELLVPSLVEGGVSGLSGFSALALQLHHDPALRRALLGLAETEDRPT